MKHTERELEKFKFGVMTKIPEGLLSDESEANIAEDVFSESIALQVKDFVLGEDLDRTHTFHYPATWFQHLKKAHAPAWVLRKWPVRYKEEILSFRVLYPGFRPVTEPFSVKVKP